MERLGWEGRARGEMRLDWEDGSVIGIIRACLITESL